MIYKYGSAVPVLVINDKRSYSYDCVEQIQFVEVSSVLDVHEMSVGAFFFNQDIFSWNVGSVTCHQHE